MHNIPAKPIEAKVWFSTLLWAAFQFQPKSHSHVAATDAADAVFSVDGGTPSDVDVETFLFETVFRVRD